MNIQINSKNYNVSDYIKGEIESHFEKLSKYFSDDSTATVTFKGERNQQKKVEITVKVKNNVLRSEVSDFDIRTAIDKAIDKIERQLFKYKGKLKMRSADSIRFENIEDTGNGMIFNITKNKKFELKPLTPEEACFELELLEHSFYVFLNEESDNISVVYKRDDGDYGLIETER